jgi:hypothetical protein
MNIFDGLAGYPRRGRQRYSAGAGAAASAGDSAVPIKSKAQRRKFAELLVEGKISPEFDNRRPEITAHSLMNMPPY